MKKYLLALLATPAMAIFYMNGYEMVSTSTINPGFSNIVWGTGVTGSFDSATIWITNTLADAGMTNVMFEGSITGSVDAASRTLWLTSVVASGSAQTPATSTWDMASFHLTNGNEGYFNSMAIGYKHTLNNFFVGGSNNFIGGGSTNAFIGTNVVGSAMVASQGARIDGGVNVNMTLVRYNNFIAAGDQSAITNGISCVILGSYNRITAGNSGYCAAIGGDNSIVAQAPGWVLGYSSSLTNSDYSSVLGGRGTWGDGNSDGSVAIGGRNGQLKAASTTLLGSEYAATTAKGQLVWAPPHGTAIWSGIGTNTAYFWGGVSIMSSNDAKSGLLVGGQIMAVGSGTNGYSFPSTGRLYDDGTNVWYVNSTGGVVKITTL